MADDGVVAVFYIGFGAFWPGVPARDLTAGEWSALDEETQATLLRLNLYQVAEGGGEDGRTEFLGGDAGELAGAGEGGGGAVRKERRRGRAEVRGRDAAGAAANGESGGTAAEVGDG